MTRDQIEKRDFTYVQIFWSQPHHVENVVVGSPFRAEAKMRAARLIPVLFGALGEPSKIYFYSRTYVAEARELFEQGLHD